MPKPVIEGEDVADTVRQAAFLMKVAHPDLDIEVELKEDPLRAQFDRRLISQALTNIIKNATEAIEQVPPDELGKDGGKGRIDVIAVREHDDIVIDVIDNGVGLPKVARARLLEPYVTTREKGTGLGLAIVGRVLEDHGGRIELKDASDFKPGQRGAWMRLRFSASAGIIGVDASGSVGILNRSAEKLIGHAESETLGHPLSDVLPELDEMMQTAREGAQRLVQGQITINRDGHERNLSVRVSAEQTTQSSDSYIITLDDITELVSAQRPSAWADVARRIAHEIKNPLTPIQLSAERLKRKYSKEIVSDPEVFEQCTDTIVRQVGDIGRMVDEFSSFARMPQPTMRRENLQE